jgi:nucleoside phosphorylase
MSVLVCAATRAELRACERGIAASEAAADFATLQTGVGPVHAARSLEACLRHEPRPALVVSSGFAGALSGRLAVGDWVTAHSLTSVDGAAHAVVEVTLREATAPAVAVSLVSSSQVVAGVSTLPVPARGAEAVDMESATLGRIAGRLGIPLMVLRVVSDTPSRPLPPFVGAFGGAMAATDRAATAHHVARGLRQALGDPFGVARLLSDGSNLTRVLTQGWKGFARIVASAGQPGTEDAPPRDVGAQ